MAHYHSEQSDRQARGQSLDNPLATVDGSNRHALVSAFLAKHYGGNYQGAGSDIQDPISTITTIDHNAIVMPYMMHYYTTVMPYMMHYYTTSTGASITDPLGTITAQGKHIAQVQAFFVKYYGQGSGQSITDPVHTVTSKDRFGLVTVHGVDYRIIDIGMRMLTPRELFLAQGFPSDYIIDRDYTGKSYSKTKQIARCGNAVPPPFAKALVEANLPELCMAA